MSDINQHKGTGHLGVEPKFMNEGKDRPFAKLFVVLNDGYEKDGVKHESTIPLNILLLRKTDVEKAHDAHTGSPISWTGKLAHRTYEVAGEKRTSFEVVIAGPGAKLEFGEPKAKEATAPENARAAIGKREQPASGSAHNHA